MPVDEDAQAAYAELRRRGVFNKDPEARAAAMELVKRGVLRDLSGGSVPPPPTPGQGDIRRQEYQETPFDPGASMRQSTPGRDTSNFSSNTRQKNLENVSGFTGTALNSFLPTAAAFAAGAAGGPVMGLLSGPLAAMQMSKLQDAVQQKLYGNAPPPPAPGKAPAAFGQPVNGYDASGAITGATGYAPQPVSDYQKMVGDIGRYKESSPTGSMVAEMLPQMLMSPPTMEAGLAERLAQGAFGVGIDAGMQKLGNPSAPVDWGSAAKQGLAQAAFAGHNNAFGGALHNMGEGARNNVISGLTPKIKATTYGSKSWDKYWDSKSDAGIGAFGPLRENSIATSPDISASLQKAGVKPRQKVWVDLKGKDGKVERVEAYWDDKTATDYNGKPMRGRVDFYGGDAPSPHDGKQVVGIQPAEGSGPTAPPKPKFVSSSLGGLVGMGEVSDRPNIVDPNFAPNYITNQTARSVPKKIYNAERNMSFTPQDAISIGQFLKENAPSYGQDYRQRSVIDDHLNAFNQIMQNEGRPPLTLEDFGGPAVSPAQTRRGPDGLPLGIGSLDAPLPSVDGKRRIIYAPGTDAGDNVRPEVGKDYYEDTPTGKFNTKSSQAASQPQPPAPTAPGFQASDPFIGRSFSDESGTKTTVIGKDQKGNYILQRDGMGATTSVNPALLNRFLSDSYQPTSPDAISSMTTIPEPPKPQVPYSQTPSDAISSMTGIDTHAPEAVDPRDQLAQDVQSHLDSVAGKPKPNPTAKAMIDAYKAQYDGVFTNSDDADAHAAALLKQLQKAKSPQERADLISQIQALRSLSNDLPAKQQSEPPAPKTTGRRTQTQASTPAPEPKAPKKNKSEAPAPTEAIPVESVAETQKTTTESGGKTEAKDVPGQGEYVRINHRGKEVVGRVILSSSNGSLTVKLPGIDKPTVVNVNDARYLGVHSQDGATTDSAPVVPSETVPVPVTERPNGTVGANRENPVTENKGKATVQEEAPAPVGGKAKVVEFPDRPGKKYKFVKHFTADGQNYSSFVELDPNNRETSRTIDVLRTKADAALANAETTFVADKNQPVPTAKKTVAKTTAETTDAEAPVKKTKEELQAEYEAVVQKAIEKKRAKEAADQANKTTAERLADAEAVMEGASPKDSQSVYGGPGHAKARLMQYLKEKNAAMIEAGMTSAKERSIVLRKIIDNNEVLPGEDKSQPEGYDPPHSAYKHYRAADSNPDTAFTMEDHNEIVSYRGPKKGGPPEPSHQDEGVGHTGDPTPIKPGSVVGLWQKGEDGKASIQGRFTVKTVSPSGILVHVPRTEVSEAGDYRVPDGTILHHFEAAAEKPKKPPVDITTPDKGGSHITQDEDGTHYITNKRGKTPIPESMVKLMRTVAGRAGDLNEEDKHTMLVAMAKSSGRDISSGTIVHVPTENGTMTLAVRETRPVGGPGDQKFPLSQPKWLDPIFGATSDRGLPLAPGSAWGDTLIALGDNTKASRANAIAALKRRLSGAEEPNANVRVPAVQGVHDAQYEITPGTNFVTVPGERGAVRLYPGAKMRAKFYVGTGNVKTETPTNHVTIPLQVISAKRVGSYDADTGVQGHAESAVGVVLETVRIRTSNNGTSGMYLLKGTKIPIGKGLTIDPSHISSFETIDSSGAHRTVHRQAEIGNKLSNHFLTSDGLGEALTAPEGQRTAKLQEGFDQNKAALKKIAEDDC